jgi:hypothetical protein
MKEYQRLEHYINLWETKNYDFFTDDEFISFIYHFDINKHPLKVNFKFLFLVSQSFQIYLKNEYKIFINSMLEIISDNDELIFIPTAEEIKRDAVLHVQREYERLRDEHIIFKRIREVQRKYGCKLQEELLRIDPLETPFKPWYVV